MDSTSSKGQLMSLHKILKYHKELCIDYNKLGVRSENNGIVLKQILDSKFPLLGDQYQISDFNIRVIKHPWTPEIFNHTYDCEIELNNHIKQLFYDLYPEELI